MRVIRILLIILLVAAIALAGCAVYFKFFAFVPDKGGMENNSYSDSSDGKYTDEQLTDGHTTE